MTGKQLKQILYHTDISFTEISKRLGITPQGLNNNLLVNDVKTGLIERLCDVLDMDITDFIPSKKVSSNTITSSVLGDGNNNVNNSTDAALLRIMENQCNQLTTAQSQLSTSQSQLTIAQAQITNLIEILKTK